jgi:hypothetical protein
MSEPERPARPSLTRWQVFAVTGIVIVAGVLRFAHLRSGVPYAVGVDEPDIMWRAVRMMKTGDFNPHFFDWPSLTIYLQCAVACLTFLSGAMHGAWRTLNQVSEADFYVTGRALTAALGTATVIVTFVAARRWGVAVALGTAVLMAVMPHHVRESHYTLTDVPMTFFVTVTWWLALRALDARNLRAFAWAGVAAGLAASAKYNGSIAIVMPAIAAVAAGGSLAAVGQRLGVIAACSAGAFLLGTPYALLDLPKFLDDYARLAAIFAAPRAGEPGWSIYLKHLRGTLATPGMIAAAIGLAATAARIVVGPNRGRWMLTLACPLVYFVVMARSFQIYGRYTLPLLPFACLFAAIGVAIVASGLMRLLRPRRFWTTTIAVAALTLVVAVVPASRSIAFDQMIARTSTMDEAYAWIVSHIPPGSKVAIESRVLLLPPAYPSEHFRSVLDHSYEGYVSEGFTYLIASTDGYQAAFAPPPPGRDALARYRTLFAQTTEDAAFVPTNGQPGPTLRIFKLTK